MRTRAGTGEVSSDERKEGEKGRQESVIVKWKNKGKDGWRREEIRLIDKERRGRAAGERDGGERGTGGRINGSERWVDGGDLRREEEMMDGCRGGLR